MSELEAIEGALLDALGTIRKHWDALLEPRSMSATGDASTDEVTALEKRLSLRGDVIASLNGWARVVMEDRPITNPKSLPLGDDPFGLAEFLERHAQWLSGHEGAGACVDELTEWARLIQSIADPKVREWVILGDCPFVVEEAGEAAWICTGKVRTAIHDGELAHCSECGQETVIEWWEEVLGIDGLPSLPVGVHEMTDLLYQRLHIRVTHRTLLNWTRHGKVTQHVAFGPQPLHPRVTNHSAYDARIVLYEVTRLDRECPMCGRIWSGRGEVCGKCSTVSLVRRYAEEKPAYTVRTVPRRLTVVVDDPHDTDRPQRCHWSDLIEDQCACGRHARGA